MKGKTPLEVVLITVLDPACGSGSFLIVAYQYLLDWHRDWYVQNLVPLLQSGLKPSSPEIRRLLPGVETGKKGRKKEPELPVYQGRDGEWKLTTAERKRILLNNIYGVDIDRQAVEVTKLSLLLKVLEGENDETISKQLKLFQERALPDLSNNIKCGNSLIGWDILKDNPGLTQEEIDRINPFDWEKEFPGVFQDGGFSVIIGNPPYVEFKRLDGKIKNLLVSEGYKSVSGKYDLYIPFVEKAINLLRLGGYLGFIIPTMFAKRDYGQSLRKIIEEKATPVEVIDFKDFQVFSNVINYVGIFIFEKGRFLGRECICKLLSNGNKCDPISVQNGLECSLSDNIFDDFIVPVENLGLSPWSLIPMSSSSFLCKIRGNPKCRTLGDPRITEAVWEGIASGKDEVFYISELQKETLGIETAITLPLLRGRDVKAWDISTKDKFYVIYPYDCTSGKVFSEDQIRSNFKNTYDYLLRCRDLLTGRGYFDKSNKKWFELWCQRDPIRFFKRKIVTPEISQKNNFMIDDVGYAFNTKVYGIITSSDFMENYLYLLGLLNSNLLNFIYTSVAPRKAGGFFAYKTQFLKELPICIIDFSDPEDVARHNRMVSLVNQMLSLNKQLKEARTPHEQTSLQRQIEATDGQIDALVYELYGLTEEEIKIVEVDNA